MPDIYCSVNNCHYWQEGNICYAKEIMVTADTLAASAPDTLDAPQHQQFDASAVQRCEETCCKTFVDKYSGKERRDGVTKR